MDRSVLQHSGACRERPRTGSQADVALRVRDWAFLVGGRPADAAADAPSALRFSIGPRRAGRPYVKGGQSDS
jgi:hypothetical protein